MRYGEVLRECSAVRSGTKHQLSNRCAKHVAVYFHDGSGPALAFASTGEITERWEELFYRFFPKEKRPDAEWTVALAFYRYLYSRRHRPQAPVIWRVL